MRGAHIYYVVAADERIQLVWHLLLGTWIQQFHRVEWNNGSTQISIHNCYKSTWSLHSPNPQWEWFSIKQKCSIWYRIAVVVIVVMRAEGTSRHTLYCTQPLHLRSKAVLTEPTSRCHNINVGNVIPGCNERRDWTSRPTNPLRRFSSDNLPF